MIIRIGTKETIKLGTIEKRKEIWLRCNKQPYTIEIYDTPEAIQIKIFIEEK